MAQNVTPQEFQKEVLDSTVPVLVDFYADWCAPCRALSPILDEIAASAGGKFKVVKVNSDDATDLCSTYKVSGLPTLLVVSGGEVKAKLVGLQNKARILEALEKA